VNATLTIEQDCNTRECKVNYRTKQQQTWTESKLSNKTATDMHGK